MNKGKIACIGKDLIKRDFYYSYTKPQPVSNDYRLTIYASSNHSDPDFFELVATPKESNELKIITITKNNDALYGAKGIPDAAIPELIVLSGMGVCSSSQKYPTDINEHRTDDATKLWDRLVRNGKAIYDQATDIYKYNYPDTEGIH